MSKVEVRGITSRTEKTYTLTLEGCEARDLQYSRTDRTYRPSRLVVVKRDGNVSSTELSGPILKKDGSDGANWHTETLFRRGEWPTWLESIVGGLA